MLRGNKALITGASKGIGFAIAKEMIKNGCKVVIAGRSKEKIEKAAASLGEKAVPMVWDVSNISIAAEKVQEAAALMGGLDILVNNAGILCERNEWYKPSLLETTVEEWESVIRTNTSAVFFNMQAAVNYMLSNQIKGNILNVTSVAGEEPIFGPYSASKLTATGLTRGWGKMFASNGITINGIEPGPVATDMNGWKEGDSLEYERIPFGRYATVEEIARLAMYLLSKDAEMLCGETVVLDGAYAIR